MDKFRSIYVLNEKMLFKKVKSMRSRGMFMEHTKKKYEYLTEDPSVKTLLISISLIIGTFFAVLNETYIKYSVNHVDERVSD